MIQFDKYRHKRAVAVGRDVCKPTWTKDDFFYFPKEIVLNEIWFTRLNYWTLFRTADIGFTIWQDKQDQILKCHVSNYKQHAEYDWHFLELQVSQFCQFCVRFKNMQILQKCFGCGLIGVFTFCCSLVV